MEQLDPQTNNIEDEVLAERLAMMIEGQSATKHRTQPIRDIIEANKK